MTSNDKFYAFILTMDDGKEYYLCHHDENPNDLVLIETDSDDEWIRILFFNDREKAIDFAKSLYQAIDGLKNVEMVEGDMSMLKGKDDD